MRWEDESITQDTRDIEDRRGERPGGFGGGGGMRVGCGTLALLLVLSVVFKKNFLQFLDTAPVQQDQQVPQGTPGQISTSVEEEELKKLVVGTVNDNQTTWDQVLPKFGVQYRHAKLVLYRDALQGGCGMAQAAMGPFYCPEDEKVYIDLSFFDELTNRFGAAGDFAQAYVIAHEVGHHVQKVVGTEGQMRRAQQRRPDMANQLSVRLELQADCYAGVWAGASGLHILDHGDIEEGINAAAAVGDDRIQKQSQGYVNPDAFTHGSAKDRATWFNQGLEKGDIRACDTFGAR